MLKVYKYCLGDVFIIDTDKKAMFVIHPVYIMKNNEEAITNKKRITKSTINRHINDSGYVISKPLLKEYAPEHLTEWDERDVERTFIGEFADYNELQKYVTELYDKTAGIREQYHFVNFGSSLWDVVKAKTNIFYHENEKALYNLLKEDHNNNEKVG